MKQTVVFYTLWCSLMSGAIYGLLHHKSAIFLDGEPIAKLIRQSGTVQHRVADGFLWQSATTKQALFVGDNISTGPRSKALIKFSSGRVLSLSADSQISIDNPSFEQNKYIVTLLRGIISAPKNKRSRKKASSKKLAIRSGGMLYKLNNSNSSIKIAKKRGSKVSSVKSLKGKITVDSLTATAPSLFASVQHIPNAFTAEPNTKPTVLTSQNLAEFNAMQASKLKKIADKMPKIAAIEKIPPKKVEKLFKPKVVEKKDQKNAPPSFVSGFGKDIYWITGSIKSNIRLPIEVMPPKGATLYNWMPFVQIGKHQDEGAKKFKRQSVLANVKSPSSYNIESFGLFKQIEVPIQLGAKMAINNSSEINSILGKTKTLKVRSVSDLKPGSVLLTLDSNFSSRASARSGFFKKPLIKNRSISVSLKSSKNVKKFNTHISTTQRFDARPARFTGKTNAYGFYKSSQLIATIPMSASKTAAKAIKRHLGATTVLKGNLSGVKSLARTEGSRLKQLNAIAKSGTTAFVILGESGEVVKIDSKFLKKAPSLATYLARKATNVFNGRIEVLFE